MKRRLTSDETAILRELRMRHSRKEINDALDKIELEGTRKPGAPAEYIGNYLAIAAFIQLHHNSHDATGKKLGVTGAAKRLERLWRGHLIQKREGSKKTGFKADRLRSVYYDIMRKAKVDPQIARQVQTFITHLGHVNKLVADKFPGAVIVPLVPVTPVGDKK